MPPARLVELLRHGVKRIEQRKSAVVRFDDRRRQRRRYLVLIGEDRRRPVLDAAVDQHRHHQRMRGADRRADRGNRHHGPKGALSETAPVADLAAESPLLLRSEERRVGKECVSTCRARWSPYHSKKKTTNR